MTKQVVKNIDSQRLGPCQAHLFKFRWPIEQCGEREVQMMVPLTGEQALFELKWNDAALRLAKVTDVEADMAHEAAIQAVIRELAIVRE